MLFMENADCQGIGSIVVFLKNLLTIIQFAVPILLIVMGTVDLGKAVMASDDKEIKGATSKLIKRAIAAIAVFFIPMIVNLLFSLIGTDDGDGAPNFFGCWNNPTGEDAGAGGGA